MRRSLLWVFSLTVIIAGCSDNSIGPEPIVIPGPTETVVFSKHIAPIFAASCSGAECHTGPNPQSELSTESWEKVMEGSKFGASVIPFDSRRSHLLQHLSTDTAIAPIALPRMPHGRDPLPREQILAIKQWIDQGARNDAGQVAYAGDRPRVFVTNQAEDVVAVIDAETERVVRYVGVGRLSNASAPPEAPHNIVMSPDGRHFYVNLIAAGLVEKFDAISLVKDGSAIVGLSPAQIAVTRDGTTLYVSNFDLTFQQRFINRIDAATMSVTAEIETGGYAPHGVTLSRDERSIYTTNAGSDDVSQIDAATGDVIGIIPIVPGSPLPPGTKAKHEPYQSVLSDDGTKLFVTCRASAQVRVIDVAAGRVVDSIAVGSRPLILERTPDGRQIWVPNQASESVSIIDVASRSVVGTITGLATQPHAVAFSADGRTAYVTCENQNGTDHHHPMEGGAAPGFVYIIDVASRTVRAVVETGAFAAGIAVR